VAGYQTILNLRKLEERVDKLGFRMGLPRHGNYRQEFGDLVALFPKEDSLPIYSRDAELFIGSLEQMEHWLNGWEKMQQYHRMLLGRDFEKRVQRKEQDYRNEELMRQIAEAGKEMEDEVQSL
jgi:hypothetical protein